MRLPALDRGLIGWGLRADGAVDELRGDRRILSRTCENQ
jgi:hypothetical protein